jgi:rRNA-processing protein FCF1
MEKIMLDTNFILSCIRNKIDFVEELQLSGREILLPIQVMDEIKKISKKEKYSLRKEAELALKFLEKSSFKKIDIKEKYVDEGIKKYLKNEPSIIIATLDRGLKKSKSRNMIITRKKKIEIV